MRRISAFVLGFGLIAGGAGAAVAAGGSGTQSRSTDRRVVVVLVEELPRLRQNYDAVVVRRAGGGDVVLLTRAKASGEVLDAAVRTLLFDRLSNGAGKLAAKKGRSGATVTIGVFATKPSSEEWRQEL